MEISMHIDNTRCVKPSLMPHRRASLDYLRFLAIALVTIQHSLSVLGFYSQATFLHLSPGQVGVALFCAISGYLAFGRVGEPISKWFLSRLTTLFPAYWLAMLFSFFVTWLFNAKDFSTWQFLSQMLGLGYFTHGWNLVNVVSWFISLILLCYVFAAIARVSGRPILVMLAVFAIAAIFVALQVEVTLSRHIMAFSVAGIIRLAPDEARMPIMFSVLILSPALWMTLGPQFGYVALSSILLLLALRDTTSLPWLEKATHYIYEYFLLHGIFLVGFVKLFPAIPMISVLIAIVVSILAALALHYAVALLWRLRASRGQYPAH